tara:strand:- start:507 stop:704 length:198 start_codon:yes stop_codon:yes gene_type:complete
MQTNIYDDNFINEIKKNYTISDLKSQIGDNKHMIAVMRDIDGELIIDDYITEIKLLENELKQRNK